MSALAIDRLSIADLFRAVWPRHGAKHAAQAAETSIHTAKKWMASATCPSAETLLVMAARNEQLRAELLRLLQEGAEIEALARRAPALPNSVADSLHRTLRVGAAEGERNDAAHTGPLGQGAAR